MKINLRSHKESYWECRLKHESALVNSVKLQGNSTAQTLARDELVWSVMGRRLIR